MASPGIDAVMAQVAQALPEPTTEDKVRLYLENQQKAAAALFDLSANGQFGDVILGFDPDTKEAIIGQSGDAQKRLALADAFDAYGQLAKNAAAQVDGGTGAISASTMAQIAQQERQLAESMRQFDISNARGAQEFSDTMGFNREELAARTEYQNRSLAEQSRIEAERLKEQQRSANLSSTLDMLTNQIRIGDISTQEAANRITAATQAAGIQRDILANHAGKALPAGTTTYPNLGANGPIAAMAAALGQPFKPFQTLGTFAIDPNAIAAPISTAPGNSALPGLNAAQQAAAAALANMGVPGQLPLKDSGGPVQGPYVSVGPEMHIPNGNGAMTIPLAADASQSQTPGTWTSDMPSSVAALRTSANRPAPSFPMIQPIPGGEPYSIGQHGTRQLPPWVQMLMNAYRNPPSGPFAPNFQQMMQQLFSGFGLNGQSPQGNSMRFPQMGGSPVANSMVGG